MSCPRNAYDLPDCHIVEHPDRPAEESFCTTCRRRFRNEQSFSPVLLLLIPVGFLIYWLIIETPEPRPVPASEPQATDSFEIYEI